LTTDDRADNPQGRHWRQRTHCKNGHAFDEANTKWVVDKKGRRIRICRACVRYRGRGFREKLYGLSLEGYKRMSDDQEGLCAICRGPSGRRALGVDHDHTTGAVRGLLCSTCNSGLGGFRDNAALLIEAIVYLNQHRKGVREVS